MNIQTIPPSTLKSWLDDKETILIDVREFLEYKIEHIKEAVIIHLSQITPEKISSSKDDNKKIVIYCESGKRGEKAFNSLCDGNVDVERDIWCLEGGIDAWKKEGLPTELSSRKILSLERQFQLTLGCLLIIFSCFGFLVDSNFFFADIIIGCGLIFAGLSGYCGLKRIISLMPWNR